MNNMSNYLKNKVLNDNHKNVFVGLINGSLEINKPSYARQAASFPDAVNGQMSNEADILFPVAGESWGSITHVATYDTATGGNQLFMAPAEFVKNIEVSSQYKIPKNYLIVRLR